MTALRRQIARAFSAAQGYDRHARVQKVVARDLAVRIAALPLPANPRILEIGCGTGFLTQALIEQNLHGDWLVTDISSEMVERCRQRVGAGDGRRFAVLDGEYGDPGEAPFDLVCSSLVMQWFDDHAAALDRMRGWLAPEGHVVFATLTAGSFAEWRAAHAAEGLHAGTPRFPSPEALTALPGTAVTIARHVETHDSALDFLRALRAIGAQTASDGHRPLSPALLRRVMHRFEAAGCAISYDVALCHSRRP